MVGGASTARGGVKREQPHIHGVEAWAAGQAGGWDAGKRAGPRDQDDASGLLVFSLSQTSSRYFVGRVLYCARIATLKA